MKPRQPSVHGSGRFCGICGEPLTVHEAVRGAHCARDVCRHAAIRLAVQQRHESGARIASRAESIRAGVAAERGIDSASLACAVVPASDRVLVPLSRARKSDFRSHLERVVAESIQLDANTAAPSPASAPAVECLTRSPAVDIEEAACATCRGQCCHAGATRYAFIDGETVGRYRSLRPGMRPRDVVAAYVRRLPRAAMEGSCVFHGETGCTLPRRMRSSVCNDYLCGELRSVLRTIENPQHRGMLIVAASATDVVRWSIYDPARDGPRSSSAGRSSDTLPAAEN